LTQVRSTDSPSVVLADDDPLYRNGLARLLRSVGIDVMGEATNGEAAIRAVQETAPDVVVMDLNMPGMSGLEATQRLTMEAPASRVLVLSVSSQEADVFEALLAGASGYVFKDGPVEDVISGIRATALGHALISSRIASMLMERVRGSGAAGRQPVAPKLSDRELEVLGLLAEGQTDHEIAETLVLPTSAVQTHVSNILMKLQAQKRMQAAVRAVRGRLV
jgi:DNA-binding NarL/FixJ family response regulator